LIKQSIARRYAKGLFAVGERDRKYRDYLGELNAVAGLIGREERLRKALMLPLLEMAKRKALLADVMSAAGISPPLSSMLTMLLENNRMGYLPMIKEAYAELVDDREGRVRGTIWSAYPLEDGVKSRVQEALAKRLNKTVVLDAVQDKGLICGVKVVIKGTIIDGSVKRQLEALKENILKE
jgi:F-type H+-transporting ATPase subunit delta